MFPSLAVTIVPDSSLSKSTSSLTVLTNKYLHPVIVEPTSSIVTPDSYPISTPFTKSSLLSDKYALYSLLSFNPDAKSTAIIVMSVELHTSTDSGDTEIVGNVLSILNGFVVLVTDAFPKLSSAYIHKYQSSPVFLIYTVSSSGSVELIVSVIVANTSSVDVYALSSPFAKFSIVGTVLVPCIHLYVIVEVFTPATPVPDVVFAVISPLVTPDVPAPILSCTVTFDSCSCLHVVVSPFGLKLTTGAVLSNTYVPTNW